MKIQKNQKNRRGELINPIAETKARVYTLEFIRRNFMSWDRFTPFNIKEYLDKKFLDSWERDDPQKIAKEKQRIQRAVKSGWLKKPDKERRFDSAEFWSRC